MARSLPEWRGKTPDTKAPPRVRQRVFDKAGGICHICSLPIKTGESWHLDHVIALIEGGENRESNLGPAHGHCNLAKANGEKTRKAKVQRTRGKHTGAIRPKQKIQSRNDLRMDKKKSDKISLPPKRLFEERSNG